MLRRHRSLAVLGLVLLVGAGVLLGARADVAVNAPATVTLDGAAIQSGASDVSPRPGLGLLLPPGSRLSDFRATLDSRPVPIQPLAGHAARLEVAELSQGTSHRLEVWRSSFGPARVGLVRVDFTVAAPLELAASWLVSGAQTTVQVSSSRELEDVGPVVAALRAAGAAVRRDDTGVEGRWPAGQIASFTVPAGVRATTGAYTTKAFTDSAGAPSELPYSRVDLSTPPASPPPPGTRLRAYYVNGPAGRASLARHAGQVRVFSPAFYAVDAEGNLQRSVDDVALGLARAGGASVEPLVTNQNFSADAARGLFGRAGAADSVGAALVGEARARGYAGYQLDFEGLSFNDRDAFSRFSVALGSRLRGAGLRYSTAVIPRKQPGAGSLEQIFGHSGAYDYGVLARDADSMSLMAYDQHTATTDPGPVAGLDWVRRVVDDSSAGLDRSRLYLGVPLYYRDWPLRGTPTAGAYSEALEAGAAHDGWVSWDFTAASPYIRYSAPGEEHVTWFENAASLAAKVQAARELGFGGVAAWRLGLEDPAWWDLWPARGPG